MSSFLFLFIEAPPEHTEELLYTKALYSYIEGLMLSKR